MSVMTAMLGVERVRPVWREQFLVAEFARLRPSRLFKRKVNMLGAAQACVGIAGLIVMVSH